MTARTTVRLPEDLMRRAKRRAAADGRTLTDLIEDGLRRVLREASTTGAKTQRILPPVARETGGRMPGIGPDIHGDVQEMEDREYVERFFKHGPP